MYESEDETWTQVDIEYILKSSMITFFFCVLKMAALHSGSDLPISQLKMKCKVNKHKGRNEGKVRGGLERDTAVK